MSRPIEVEVWEFDLDAFELQLIDTLESDAQREWLDDLYDTGAFSFEIKAGHDDEAICQPGRYVRFVLNGTPRWWGVIESLSKVSADPSRRQSGRVVTVKGRGGLSLLEFAPIYPELGLGRVSPDTRYFNFASWNYFDASSWPTATALKQQNDPADPWSGAPLNWPDPDAWWIGPSGSDTPPIDPGDVYFRGTFLVGTGEGGEYRFHLTADDGFELYIDGDKRTAEQGVGLWGATRYYDALLDEGSHLVGVKAINFDRPNPSTNVFGFILSVHKLLGGGQTLGDVVSRSSSFTKMLAWPTEAPGMTPGLILIIPLQEAWSLYSLLVPVNIDFDDTIDSGGTDWPTKIDVAVPVGSSILELIRKLIAEKALEVAIDPAATDFITLQAFVSKGENRTGDVEISYGDNIGALGHDRNPAGANAFLLRTAEGRWLEVTDPASIAARGKRARFLSLGAAPSNEAGVRQAEALLEDESTPIDVITHVQVEVVPGGPAPYEDYTTGDRITAPDFEGDPDTFRVTGIRVSEDAAGQPIYQLDLEAA